MDENPLAEIGFEPERATPAETSEQSELIPTDTQNAPLSPRLGALLGFCRGEGGWQASLPEVEFEPDQTTPAETSEYRDHRLLYLA